MPKTTGATDDVRRIGLRYLIPNPDNPRAAVDGTHPEIVALAASIDQVGLLEPLIVTPDPANDPAQADEARYMIVAGYRRWLALRSLPDDRRVKQDGVLCVVRSDLTADSGRLTAAALVENLQRVDLTPMEEARAYAALKAEPHGWNQARISEAVGRNQGHVSKRLSLLKLLPELQKKVDVGELVIEQAIDAAKLPAALQDAVVSLHTSGQPYDMAIRGVTARAVLLVERTRLVKELKAAGVPMLDGAENPGAPVPGVPVASALWWMNEGDHDGCNSRLVFVRADPKTNGDSPAARWLAEYCTAKDAPAKHPRSTPDEQGKEIRTAADDEADAAHEAERVARAERAEAAAAARAARVEFMRTVLAGKLPKTAVDHVLRMTLVDQVLGTELWDATDRLATAADLLGVEVGTPGAVSLAVDFIEAAKGGDKLWRWAVALRFVNDEALISDLLLANGEYDPDTDAGAVAHLRYLASLGHKLSALEEAFVELAGAHPVRRGAESMSLLDVPGDVVSDDEAAAAEDAGDVDDAPSGAVVVDGTVVAVTEHHDLPEVEDLAAGDRARVEADEMAESERVEAAAEASAVPLPDDLHTYQRDALVELARRRGVETTPRMTKLAIRTAIEKAAVPA